MAQWQTVGEGTSLFDLKEVVADMQLTKGTKMRVVMDLKLPVGWAFDVAGAELLFKPFVPDGMKLLDVYGEGNQGIVEMEADPAFLLAVLGFIKAHWLAITIAGVVLAVLVSFIVVMIKVPPVLQPPIWLLVGAAVAILGLTLIRAKGSTARRS